MNQHIVTRMARREAAAHLLVASTALSVRINLFARTCPWCGAGQADALARASALPIRGWKPGYDWAPESHGHPTLEILGCEALTARSLLPLGAAAHHFPELRNGRFRSRAVTWLELGSISAVDAAERWIDYLLVASGTANTLPPTCETETLTLPAASRSFAPGVAHEDSLAPHFLTPHHDASAELNQLYLDTRADAVRRLGGFAVQDSY
ncbi:hypothetical protein SAMN05421504_11394 [Amycolatopsis xylanica]|uniref:Uncharacterized protein n=1 Tax=Amycolatopsis xylanica TaxID=589385 RepID=A0A1H3SDQ1_9PSEU|nr:hypothetical protein [Amycolatopsis xylanica]SDZ35219.1 hypothetical protein SAMN05421504_11394 [Amycolatopsis xylanica]